MCKLKVFFVDCTRWTNLLVEIVIVLSLLYIYIYIDKIEFKDAEIKQLISSMLGI